MRTQNRIRKKITLKQHIAKHVKTLQRKETQEKVTSQYLSRTKKNH